MVIPIQSSINLVFQIVIVCILILGLLYRRNGKLLDHGWLMTLIVILNTVSLLAVMAPSFVVFSLSGFLGLNLNTGVNSIHMVIGLSAEFFGVYLVVNWRFSTGIERCYVKSIYMRAAAYLYTLAFILGLITYPLYFL